MRNRTLSLILPACASILTHALSGCGGSQPGALPGPATMTQSAAIAPSITTGTLKATPTALNFTTSPTMNFTVRESKYTGKFKLAVSPKHLIKLSSATPKGPTAKVKVTAVNAGKGTISVSDDHGGKKSVPFTVTQGVIVIQ